MNDFLHDLLHDLREKRLAPVAAVLLVALVAVPLVLSKSGGAEPASPPKSDQPADVAATPTVVKAVNEGPEPGGSNLGVFRRRDPFKSGVKLTKSELADGVAQLVNPAAGAGAGATASPKPSGGSPSTGTTSPKSGSSPAPATTPARPAPVVKPKKVSYAYVADVTLTRGAHSRRIRTLHRLDMLPSEASPLLIFLGVTAKGNSAVFLVDSTLKTEGEGNCRPSASECATLSIGPGSEHAFIGPDGKSLFLQINEIRKVRISPRASSSSRKRPRARTSVGARRRFVPPVLADVLTEFGNPSSAGKDRR